MPADHRPLFAHRPLFTHEHAYARAADDHTGPLGDELAMHALLAARQGAREDRNFKRADKLRAELAALGVEVCARVRRYANPTALHPITLHAKTLTLASP